MDDACHHCGLPLGSHPVGSDPWFCCTGCQTVHRVLTESGYAETYYRLQSATADLSPRVPASTGENPLLLSELDAQVFLDEHTDVLDDGKRRVCLYVNGVHCAACVWLVERMPQDLEGVAKARLDLPRSQLTLEWDDTRTSLSTAARWLARFGYAVQPRVQSRTEGAVLEERALLTRVGVSWAIAANVMLIAFALYSGLDEGIERDLNQAARWVSFALTIPAILYGARPFFERAWASVRDAARRRSLLHLHMDTPISIGILVGFGHSAVATITGRGDIWFDSIAVLIAALLTARWIQFRSQRMAGDAADRLLALIPTMARTVTDGGDTKIVPAAEIQSGTVVEVPAGEVVPVDGTVVSGMSHLDNASLTGESRPVAIGIGAEAFAGATNLSATIRIETQATADETRVGQLLNWVSTDTDATAPVTMLADKLSGYFVASVLALAVTCSLIWYAIDPSQIVSNVVALLVITCPCALGMATPLAMAVGSGRAARKGIFVKGGSAIQTLTEVDTVVLDKTGTLTFGRPGVVGIEGDPEALELASLLEADSLHPIAAAIRRAAPAPADPPIVRAITELGKGVRGSVGEVDVAVGQLDWLASRIGKPAARFLRAERRFAADGATPVGIAVSGKIVAVVAVADELRPDAGRLVNRLREQASDVYICSGDHVETVGAVAHTLGVDKERAIGRAAPEDKLALIEQLSGKNLTVAMVGDGVNDAAALRRADVGVAVAGSSMAGQVASDVFVTGRGSGSLALLFDGAHRIMRTIKRNLTFSLAYNIAGATAAILGLVTPLFAAVAMPVSSLVVVVSSSVQKPFRQSS